MEMKSHNIQISYTAQDQQLIVINQMIDKIEIVLKDKGNAITNSKNLKIYILTFLLYLLSSSDSCKNEIMISKDERILVFQGHPEYSSAGMNMISLTSRLPSEYSTLDQVIKDVKRLYPQEQDPFHLNLCLKFLKIEK